MLISGSRHCRPLPVPCKRFYYSSRHYVFPDEWHRANLSQYHQALKSGAIDSAYRLRLPTPLNDHMSPPLVGANGHFPLYPPKSLNLQIKTKDIHYLCFTKKIAFCSPCTHKVRSNRQPASNRQPPKAAELHITIGKPCFPCEHCTSAINPFIQPKPGVYPVFN